MLLRTCALLLFLLAGDTYAVLPLPTWLKPCARSSPDFNACALDRANIAIPRITKGLRKYKVPPIDPLEVTEISVDNTGPRQAGISIKMKNCKIYGAKDTVMKEVMMDFDKKKYTLKMFFPRAEVIGEYEVTGRVLLLPIVGHGPMNFTMVDIEGEYESDLEIITKEGVEHLAFTNPRVTKLEPKKAYYDLKNLFNGDKFLGPEMNNVLNANWKDAFQELSPPVVQAIAEIIATISNNISGAVPYSVAFPEKVDE